ncbi:DUF6182 family protein [Streptomyces sp. NPDC088131]|uniref:DUF6182 family protein n=1 Tax=Streptomyces sp. NPDC088131 TaxID=3365826 RepID=UPI0037FDEFF9
MTLTQQRLHEEALGRLRAGRPDLAAAHAGADGASLLALREAVAASGADEDAVQAVVVLRACDLDTWIAETCLFALALAEEPAAAWRRSFTRTVFLAGNPRNLAGRFAFDHVAADGSAAWCAPAPAAATVGLRRLLKTFSASAPLEVRPPRTIRIPGRPEGRGTSGVSRDLYVSTAGVRVPQALVHLGHLLVEAVMDGLIGPGDRLTLRCVTRVTGVAAPLSKLRVDFDPTHPSQLRAFAGLSEEIPCAHA